MRKKERGGKHTRPKKWSGARRAAGPATTALHSKEELIIRDREKNNSSTCNCKNGKLKNLCIYLRPNPFLIDDSAYLT